MPISSSWAYNQAFTATVCFPIQIQDVEINAQALNQDSLKKTH